ncbi:MAG: ATP-binding protein, partial [Lachnospirales bacterium]
GAVPCGACPGCRKVLGDIHPDVITIGDDGKGITVAQSRQIRADAYVRPNEAPRKVYVIQNAQTMNASAQNALLKLLEEGPAYAAFLLLTDNPAALLPTVRSRCEGLALSPVPRAEAEAWLTRRFPGKEPEEIRNAAAGCGGLLGRAVERLEGTRGDGAAAEAARILIALLAKGDELALAAYCVSLEKWDRDALAALLDHSVALLRDALALQAGAGQNVGPEERETARQAAELSRKTLLESAGVLEALRDATEFHVGAGHLCGALSAGLGQAGG